MKKLISLLACLIPAGLFAGNPTFGTFDTNWFSVSEPLNIITLNTGEVATLLPQVGTTITNFAAGSGIALTTLGSTNVVSVAGAVTLTNNWTATHGNANIMATGAVWAASAASANNAGWATNAGTASTATNATFATNAFSLSASNWMAQFQGTAGVSNNQGGVLNLSVTNANIIPNAITNAIGTNAGGVLVSGGTLSIPTNYSTSTGGTNSGGSGAFGGLAIYSQADSYTGDGGVYQVTNWQALFVTNGVLGSAQWGYVSNTVAGEYLVSAWLNGQCGQSVWTGADILRIYTNNVLLCFAEQDTNSVSANSSWKTLAISPTPVYLPANCAVTLQWSAVAGDPVYVESASLSLQAIPAGGGGGGSATNISGGAFSNVTLTGSSTIPYATTAGTVTNAWANLPFIYVNTNFYVVNGVTNTFANSYLTIQAAINDPVNFAKTNAAGSFPIGSEIMFAPGQYYCSNFVKIGCPTNTLPGAKANGYPTAYRFVGAGEYVTQLIYSGTTNSIKTNGFVIVGEPSLSSGNNGAAFFNFSASDMGFWCSDQTNNVAVVYVNNMNQAFFDQCVFGLVNTLTNAALNFSAVQLGASAQSAPSLINLYINSQGDNAVKITHCAFSGGAVGLYATCDHLRVVESDFGGFGVYSNQTQYGTSLLTNNPCYLGAAIVDAVRQEAIVDGCHIVTSVNDILVVESPYQYFQDSYHYYTHNYCEGIHGYDIAVQDVFTLGVDLYGFQGGTLVAENNLFDAESYGTITNDTFSSIGNKWGMTSTFPGILSVLQQNIASILDVAPVVPPYYIGNGLVLGNTTTNGFYVSNDIVALGNIYGKSFTGNGSGLTNADAGTLPANTGNNTNLLGSLWDDAIIAAYQAKLATNGLGLLSTLAAYAPTGQFLSATAPAASVAAANVTAGALSGSMTGYNGTNLTEDVSAASLVPANIYLYKGDGNHALYYTNFANAVTINFVPVSGSFSSAYFVISNADTASHIVTVGSAYTRMSSLATNILTIKAGELGWFYVDSFTGTDSTNLQDAAQP